MNKLRKPRPVIRDPPQTNNVAATSSSSNSTSRLSIVSNSGTIFSRRVGHPVSSLEPTSTSFGYAGSAGFHPRYTIEQYWAVRALTAETLLSSRTSHQQELRSLSFAEERKRSKALSALTKTNEARHAKLEKFIVALLCCLLLLVMFVIYLATHQIRETSPQHRRWSPPSHFTIPILSPFTTVVEHEMSVIGSKSITIFLVVLAGLGYMIFRHWLVPVHHR